MQELTSGEPYPAVSQDGQGLTAVDVVVPVMVQGFGPYLLSCAAPCCSPGCWTTTSTPQGSFSQHP